MKKFLLITLTLIVCMGHANAQKAITVKGKVTDETGKGIEAVTVRVVGTMDAISTIVDGTYKITAPNNAKLEFSFVGIKKEVDVNNREFIDVEMDLSIELAEVMVTGYQTISKERASGSFTSIKDNLLERRPVSLISSALVGATPGMVANVDKEGKLNFVIRGTSTLSQDNEDIGPLLVVDGFAVESNFSSINPNDVKSITILKDAAATSIYGARAANGVIVITTKGASAKNEKNKMQIKFASMLSISERNDLDYNLNIVNSRSQLAYEDIIFPITQLSQNPSIDNSTRMFRSLYTNLLWNNKNGKISDSDFKIARQKLENTDYKDQYNQYLLRNQVSQQHNLNIDGSSEKNRYSLSLLYENDLTEFQRNNKNKFNINFKNIYSINDRLEFSFFTNTNMEFNKLNGTSMGTLRSVTSPYTTLLNDAGNYTSMPAYYYDPALESFAGKLPYSNTRYNTLEESQLRNNSQKQYNSLIQSSLVYKITKDLKLTNMFQYENNTYSEDNIYNDQTFAARNLVNLTSKKNTVTGLYDPVFPKGGFRRQVNQNYNSVTFKGQVDYLKKFNEKNELVALVGYEIKSANRNFYPAAFKFGFNESNLTSQAFDYKTMPAYFDNGGYAALIYEGSGIYDYSSTMKETRYADRFLSTFLNLSYTYDNKYTGTFTMRSDASNYVTSSLRNKFSPFWAAGMLWDIRRENFLDNITWLNRLMVRGTYGISGLPAGRKSASTMTTISSATDISYFINKEYASILGRENQTLTWEKTASLNLGIDFALFNNTLYGSLEGYRRHTKNALSNNQVSILVSGQTSEVFNNGEILNEGVELSLGTNLKISNKLNYNGQLNLSYNYNEVLKYEYISTNLSINLSNGIYIPGRPTDYKYAIHLSGVTADGFLIQKKSNGEEVIANKASNMFYEQSFASGMNLDEDGRLQYMGRLTPPTYAGFINTLTFGRFSFMAMFTGKFGHVFSRRVSVAYYNTGSLFNSKEIEDFWTPEEGQTERVALPMPVTSNLTMLSSMNTLYSLYSDAVIESASHIRLNEIYLGYDLNVSKINRLKKTIKSASFFAQVMNVGLVWTANKYGIDPDYISGYAVKQPRRYTAGIKINF